MTPQKDENAFTLRAPQGAGPRPRQRAGPTSHAATRCA